MFFLKENNLMLTKKVTKKRNTGISNHHYSMQYNCFEGSLRTHKFNRLFFHELVLKFKYF